MRRPIAWTGHTAYLTAVMALTDFKIKYDGSVLGYLWSLLKPLMMFGTLMLVFSVFTRWPVDHYGTRLLLGIVLWNFFAEVTLNSMVLLESKGPLFKRVCFPRWVVVVASSLTSLLTLGLNLGVFVLFAWFDGIGWSPRALTLLLSLVELYALSLGAAFGLCALYPRFRDIHHIWEVLSQLGFWLTPVVYPVAVVPQRFHRWIFLNPLARIVEAGRQAVIGPPGPWIQPGSHAVVSLVAALVLGGGWMLYRRRSREFAESL